MTIGTFVSSLLVGPFSSMFGRKVGLWTAALLNFVATAIMLGTTSVGALYFARLLLGSSAYPWLVSAKPAHTQQEFLWVGF